MMINEVPCKWRYSNSA